MAAIISAVDLGDIVAGIGTIAGVIALAQVARLGARKLLGMIR